MNPRWPRRLQGVSLGQADTRSFCSQMIGFTVSCSSCPLLDRAAVERRAAIVAPRRKTRILWMTNEGPNSRVRERRQSNLGTILAVWHTIGSPCRGGRKIIWEILDPMPFACRKPFGISLWWPSGGVITRKLDRFLRTSDFAASGLSRGLYQSVGSLEASRGLKKALSCLRRVDFPRAMSR